MVTTLTGIPGYPKDAILDLFHDRWHVELDLRAIKQSLQMEVLRCQTPAMLHKEIWAHLLAYNLVRPWTTWDVDATRARSPINLVPFKNVSVGKYKSCDDGAIRSLRFCLPSLPEGGVATVTPLSSHVKLGWMSESLSQSETCHSSM